MLKRLHNGYARWCSLLYLYKTNFSPCERKEPQLRALQLMASSIIIASKMI
jgi:hypothetical protein